MLSKYTNNEIFFFPQHVNAIEERLQLKMKRIMPVRRKLKKAKMAMKSHLRGQEGQPENETCIYNFNFR